MNDKKYNSSSDLYSVVIKIICFQEDKIQKRVEELKRPQHATALSASPQSYIEENRENCSEIVKYIRAIV